MEETQMDNTEVNQPVCRFYKDGKCTYGGESRDCAYECRNNADD